MGKGSYLRFPMNQELRIANQRLKAENCELREQMLSMQQEYQQNIASLKAELAQIYKLLSGFKSERFVAAIAEHQLSLFEAEASQEQSTPATETITYTRDKQKHPGRHALPEHLPVREVIIEPEEDTTGLKKIGEEITETLEYTPASLVKRRTIRP